MTTKVYYNKVKGIESYIIKHKETNRKWYNKIKNTESHKIKRKESNKRYYERIKNTESYKERVKTYGKKWRDNNKDYYLKRLSNSDWGKYLKKYQEEYRKKNEDYFKDYYKKRKNYLTNKSREWHKNNKEKKNITQRKYRKILRTTNLKWVLIERMRSRIWKVLKGNPKITTTKKLLGCTLEEFKIYLESKFKKDMTWDNYGLWHIDHIKPCASFDLVCPVQQLSCFHYKNLQPLWALENMSKGSKLIDIAE